MTDRAKKNQMEKHENVERNDNGNEDDAHIQMNIIFEQI